MNEAGSQPTGTENVEPQRRLTEDLKERIRDAYRLLQANTPGFSTRRAQSQMIGVVSRALGTSGGVGVAEAPTGVGKSLGYLTAGVPIALAAKKKLVISTGTVALQSQLVERDIPAFLKATGIEASVALAKGRTRYLCTRNAAEVHGEATQDALFEGEGALYERPLGPADVEVAQRLSEAWDDQRWNGDLDSAPETVSPALRMRITTPASGCSGRRCAYSAQCPVLKARLAVREAQIIVTNHALLLSALALGDGDGGQPLLAPPGDMLLVLDEGHHVAGVAIDQGAANLPLADMATRAGRLQILIASSCRLVDKEKIGSLLPSEAVELAARVAKRLRAFHVEIERVWTPDPSEREPLWRAPEWQTARRLDAGRGGTRRGHPRAVHLGRRGAPVGRQGQTGGCRARAPAAQSRHGARHGRAAARTVERLEARGPGRPAADGALGHAVARRRPGLPLLAGVRRAGAAHAAVERGRFRGDDLGHAHRRRQLPVAGDRCRACPSRPRWSRSARRSTCPIRPS